jgi:hypothetical protein
MLRRHLTVLVEAGVPATALLLPDKTAVMGLVVTF